MLILFVSSKARRGAQCAVAAPSMHPARLHVLLCVVSVTHVVRLEQTVKKSGGTMPCIFRNQRFLSALQGLGLSPDITGHAGHHWTRRTSPDTPDMPDMPDIAGHAGTPDEG